MSAMRVEVGASPGGVDWEVCCGGCGCLVDTDDAAGCKAVARDGLSHPIGVAAAKLCQKGAPRSIFGRQTQH